MVSRERRLRHLRGSCCAQEKPECVQVSKPSAASSSSLPRSTTPAVASAWTWGCQLARSPQVWIEATMPGAARRSAGPARPIDSAGLGAAHASGNAGGVEGRKRGGLRGIWARDSRRRQSDSRSWPSQARRADTEPLCLQGSRAPRPYHWRDDHCRNPGAADDVDLRLRVHAGVGTPVPPLATISPRLRRTPGDSRGLDGATSCRSNSLPRPDLTTKVAHRRRFSKRAASGSIPAASTKMHSAEDLAVDRLDPLRFLVG